MQHPVVPSDPGRSSIARVFRFIPWVFAIAAVFGFVISVIFFFWGIAIVRNASDSTSWPQVDGIVIRSEVGHSVATPHHRRRNRNPSRGAWTPRVRYAYSVDGSDFENSRISYGVVSNSSSRSDAHEIVERYPNGAQVSVYCKRDQPGEAVLEPGAPLSSYLGLWLGLAGSVVTSGILLASTYLLRKRNAGNKG